MGSMMISIPDELKSYPKEISKMENKPISRIITELIILKKMLKEISWDDIFEKFSKKMGKIKREEMWK